MNNKQFNNLTPDQQIQYNMLKGEMRRLDTNLLQAHINLLHKQNEDLAAASDALKADIIAGQA